MYLERPCETCGRPTYGHDCEHCLEEDMQTDKQKMLDRIEILREKLNRELPGDYDRISLSAYDLERLNLATLDTIHHLGACLLEVWRDSHREEI